MKSPNTKNGLIVHKIKMIEDKTEVAMEKTVRYDRHTYPDNGYAVIFEFPAKSELDDQIEMEVKSIMTVAVKEHLRRTS